MDLSVIICTHNPREDFLRRTLQALQNQTLPKSQWELLLIDNASAQPLDTQWDLSWHAHGRQIRENEVGLTPARLRGMTESKGKLLVLVDDDNLLANNYLLTALELFKHRPDLGAISGRITPEYEVSPPSWFAPYESWIAVRPITASLWANFWDPKAEPCGAGMCLRREVASSYVAQVHADPRQKILDRRAGSLLSGGDVAITKVATHMGLTMGQFTELCLTHLIPSRRVSESYLFLLYRNLQASGRLMNWLENKRTTPPALPSMRFWMSAIKRTLKGGSIQRRLVYEEVKAAFLARKVAKEILTEIK